MIEEPEPQPTGDLFQRRLEQAESMARQQQGEALMLLGEVQDAIPRALIMDADVPAIAVRVWCYLRLSADTPDRSMMAPGYAEIMKNLNIGSRETVSHAYQVLRLTRWLTLITRHTNRWGYRIGNVYGLHTVPADIGQTLELDASYLPFVQYLCSLDPDSRRHARIRGIAVRILEGVVRTAGLPEETAADAWSRVLGTYLDHEQRTEEGCDVYCRAPNSADTDDGEMLEYLPDFPEPGPADLPAPPADLDFHDGILGFSAKVKKIVTGQLSVGVPEDLHQDFLTELAVIVRDRRTSPDPIRNPPNYLKKLIERHGKGESVLSNRIEQLDAERRESERKADQQRRAEADRIRSEIRFLKQMQDRSRSRNKDPDPMLQKQIDELTARMNNGQSNHAGLNS